MRGSRKCRAWSLFLRKHPILNWDSCFTLGVLQQEANVIKVEQRNTKQNQNHPKSHYHHEEFIIYKRSLLHVYMFKSFPERSMNKTRGI